MNYRSTLLAFNTFASLVAFQLVSSPTPRAFHLNVSGFGIRILGVFNQFTILA